MLEEEKKEVNWTKVKKTRLIKTLLLFPGCLVIPYVLFWSMEVILWAVGNRQWERKMRDENLATHIAETIPEIPPAEDNFASLPFISAYARFDSYNHVTFRVEYDSKGALADDRKKIYDLPYIGIELINSLKSTPFDWASIGGGYWFSGGGTKEEVKKEVEKLLAPLLPQMTAAKDRKYSQFPYHDTSEVPLVMAVMSEVDYRLNSLASLLALQNYIDVEGDKAATNSGDIAKILLHLVFLKQSLDCSGFSSEETALESMEYVWRQGIKNRRWSTDALQELLERLKTLDYIEAGIQQSPRIWEITEYLPAHKDEILNELASNLSIDLPVLKHEDKIILAGLRLIPSQSFKLCGLAFRKADYKYHYHQLLNRRAEPKLTEYSHSLHTIVIKPAYTEVFIKKSRAHRVFDNQTRVNLLQIALQLEIKRLVSGAVSVKDVPEFEDYFNPGSHLQVVETNSDITIYSYGPDFNDDSGDPDLDISLTWQK